MKINFKDKSTITLMVILAVVSVMTIGIGAYYLLSEPAGIKVEDFKNKQVQDVMSWVDANKLKEEQIEYIYQYDEEIAKDTVISQSIQAEEILKKDGKISFTVSKGADPDLMVTLPDFTQMTKEEISQFFEQNKFTDVTFEYTTDKKIKKDGFIKINIEGTEARRGDLIIVTISVGETNVGIDITMPDFKDSTRANIKAWGETNNITITFKTESSDTIAEGKVISQSVNAGETIQTGSKVTIVLSAGKGITLTNLAGKTKEEVEAWVKESGAKVDYISYYADGTAEGKVISTTPGSGTVATGTTIKVYMSLGSVKAIDFTGKKEADVKTWVDTINKSIYDKNNYIKYKIVTDNTSDKAAGTILKTSPAKTETIKLAGTLTITVAGTKTVSVESKSNITVDELKKYLEGIGMKLGSKSSEVYSDTIAKDKVVRNDSGSKAAGSTINYTTSLGIYNPQKTEFENKTQSAVQALLNEAKGKEAGNWSFTAGERVFSSNPKENTVSCSVANKKVTCTISKGAGVTVKNYVGNDKPCNLESCDVDGLKIIQIYKESNEPQGRVIAQDIASGTKVEEGTKITLTLSKGPQPTDPPETLIEIPNLNLDFLSVPGDYDKAQTNIKNALTKAGFTNIDVIKLTGEDNPNGYVGIIKEYSPASGKVPADTKIVVKIYGSN